MKTARFVAAALVALAASRAAAQRADAVLLVNSTSAHYADASQYVRPYLDHFGVPYTVLDIATTNVGPEIADYALIVVGHSSLDPAHRDLDATEQANLSNAVREGCGLVNFDSDLTADGSTPRYPYVQDIFGFGYQPARSGNGLLFGAEAPAHYVSIRHQAEDTIETSLMTAAGLTVPTGVMVLVRVQSTGAPLLAVTSYGQGRAVQWGSYDWMSHSVLGPIHGMDDLVWRALVWAARKPFVMQGMPNFLTLRVDDVVGGFWWVRTANSFRLKPWLGLFYGSVASADVADLSTLVNSGLATASIHARSSSDFFYFDHLSGQNFPDSTVASYFDDATAWHSDHGIPIARYVTPHFYEFGTNVFAGLQNWGVQFVGTQQLPGSRYGAPWLMAGPYRMFETGISGAPVPMTYADYLTIPGHPELANRFFNCVTEIRDDAGYEWYPDNDVTGSIERGTRQTKRALDSMALATLFTHEYGIRAISPGNWQSILSGVVSNLAPYNPVYVTLDDACQYLRAKHDSKITSSLFDPATQTLTTDLSGSTDVPTQFYVFSGVGGTVFQAASSVPAFSVSTRVTQQLAAPPTLSITTASLPGGMQGIAYTAPLAASGGVVPYTWSTGSGLPPGLSIHPGTGVLSGTPSAVGVYSFTVQVTDAAAQMTTRNLSLTIVAQTDLSVWPSTTVPIRVDAGADIPVELGVKLRSDMAGSITGLRFYKAALNTGTHVGHLWSSTGTLLATATFSGETGSGWQQVTFSAPVTIAADTVYVASYHCTGGHYSADRNFFATQGVDSPPLHLLASGASGGNGVYGYGAAGTFPALNYQASNYWVDVVFSVQPPPPTLSAIAVTPASPSIVSGATQQFIATGTYSDGSTQSLTSQVVWASSSPWVATINQAGLATAIAAGSTTISAALGGVMDNATLTVTPAPPTLSAIAVTPASPSIESGATQQFNATGTYSDGSTRSLTAQVRWASSKPSVATINGAGLATAIAAGSTRISAALGDVMGNTTLTVRKKKK